VVTGGTPGAGSSMGRGGAGNSGTLQQRSSQRERRAAARACDLPNTFGNSQARPHRGRGRGRS
jgi:hypothetical protein